MSRRKTGAILEEEHSFPATDLSMIGGGASTRIVERLARVHLADRRGYIRLAVILAAVTWVPLAMLAALYGAAVSGSVREPFFRDFAPHVRFLFALPLLIIADLFVGPQIVRVGRQFVTSGLVSEPAMPEFDRITRAAMRMRDSNAAELVVLLIAYATAIYNFYRELGTASSSWLVTGAGAGLRLTPAGWWYVLLSVPIYQFFLFRWLFRLCSWAVFLWRVSRLDLEIVPTHPDGAGGLGFVGQALAPTSVIVFAASAVLSGSIATQVIYRGARLEEFAVAFGLFVIVASVVFLAPYAVFVPKLALARRDGLMKYGALATRYVQLFDRKWTQRERPTGEALLGTGDIQSLADMGNSFDRVDNMKLFPLQMADLRALLVAALLPFLPLVLTQVSMKDVMQMLTRVLF